MTYKAYLVASKEDLLKELRWAEARRASMTRIEGGWQGDPEDVSWARFLKALTKDEYMHLKGYEKKYPGMPCNVSQNPDVKPQVTSGDVLQTLTKHCFIWVRDVY